MLTAGDTDAQNPPSNRAIDFRAPHRYLDVGHSRLAYWRAGRGPDVLFIHGWPLHAATFRHVVRELADAFTCHLIDLPGAGLTECNADAPVEIVAHAATARAAVDALGLTRYGLVAHDSGGFVARHLAAADERAACVVLGNTEIPGYVPPLLTGFVLLSRLGIAKPLMRATFRLRMARTSPLGFGDCFENPASVEGEFRELFIDPLLASDRRMDGCLTLLRNATTAVLDEMRSVHGRIRAPVQLVWGADDPWFPAAKARAMLGQFGGPASMVEVPRAKLFLQEDHAAEFSAHARALLTTSLAAPEADVRTR